MRIIALLSSGPALRDDGASPRVGPDQPLTSARGRRADDRFSAPPDGAKRIEEAVAALEKAATDDEKPSFPRDLMVIDGDWDLRFTNNAPPPPPDWVPFDTSGLVGRDVVQKIDVMGRRVKNCVTVAPWPSAVLDGLDGLPPSRPQPALEGVGRAEPGPQLLGGRRRLDARHAEGRRHEPGEHRVRTSRQDPDRPLQLRRNNCNALPAIRDVAP